MAWTVHGAVHRLGHLRMARVIVKTLTYIEYRYRVAHRFNCRRLSQFILRRHNFDLCLEIVSFHHDAVAF